ncbi:hypothetical protein SAMN05892877_12378 [Rhizobium subbaraonis]|uniref:Mu-like prophage FluMu N-terminal domain-containing protein n=1 Tax=Rhizobium subbaraonis TaxID=908946 RepID=A0A285UXK8_9HYPH|nr:HI1506-related protein [Rhizobium subbaraonis]SOC46655.1 hypothetical protein SAMN05892877_12378 [Rhizobium subbaraonis]
MSKRKTNTPAADDAAKGVGTGSQPSVVSVNETEGGPSGTNGPDGTNPPESDLNGEAGNSAGLADRGQQSGGEDASSFVVFEASDVGGVTAEKIKADAITAVARGLQTYSEASQGDAAEGTGANAGPVFTLDDVLVAAAADNVAQLLHFADIGQRLLAVLASQGSSMSADDYIARLRLAEDASTEKVNSVAIRVTGPRDGFRRAGIALSKAGQTFEPGQLTLKQIAALIDDPGITVEYL